MNSPRAKAAIAAGIEENCGINILSIVAAEEKKNGRIGGSAEYLVISVYFKVWKT
jgi:hypothetical protein